MKRCYIARTRYVIWINWPEIKSVIYLHTNYTNKQYFSIITNISNRLPAPSNHILWAITNSLDIKPRFLYDIHDCWLERRFLCSFILIYKCDRFARNVEQLSRKVGTFLLKNNPGHGGVLIKLIQLCISVLYMYLTQGVMWAME